MNFLGSKIVVSCVLVSVFMGGCSMGNGTLSYEEELGKVAEHAIDHLGDCSKVPIEDINDCAFSSVSEICYELARLRSDITSFGGSREEKRAGGGSLLAVYSWVCNTACEWQDVSELNIAEDVLVPDDVCADAAVVNELYSDLGGVIGSIQSLVFESDFLLSNNPTNSSEESVEDVPASTTSVSASTTSSSSTSVTSTSS